MVRHVAQCLVLAALTTSNVAWAQEPPTSGDQAAQDAEERPGPITRPPDLGYGDNQLAEQFRFPDETAYSALVDRRDDIDAASHRTILWPTAHTPRRFTIQYSNFMGALNQLSFSPTDAVQLSGTVLIPSPTADFRAGLASKLRLHGTTETELSLQPFGLYREGNREPGTRDLGVGVALLFDFIVSNKFVATLGAAGYATGFYGREVFDYADCESRSDFLDGSCRTLDTQGTAFPSGGHFFGVQVAGTYYVLESFSLRGELFSGAATGTVLGTEFLVVTPSLEDDRRRFEEGEVAAGLPYDSKITAGLGLQWSNGLFAVQFSGYAYRGPAPFGGFDGNRAEIWLLTPMLNGAVAF